MLPKNARQKKYCDFCNALYAVIRELWVAAFLNSTKYAVFPHALNLCVLIFTWVRFFVPFFEGFDSTFPRCRSPPLISICLFN